MREQKTSATRVALAEEKVVTVATRSLAQFLGLPVR